MDRTYEVPRRSLMEDGGCIYNFTMSCLGEVEDAGRVLTRQPRSATWNGPVDHVGDIFSVAEQRRFTNPKEVDLIRPEPT